MQLEIKPQNNVQVTLDFTPRIIHGIYMVAERVPTCAPDEIAVFREIYQRAGRTAFVGIAMGWDVPPREQLQRIVSDHRFGINRLPDDYWVGPHVVKDGREVVGGIALYAAKVSRDAELADVVPIDALYWSKLKRPWRHGGIK